MKNRFIFTLLAAAFAAGVAVADPVDYVHPTRDVLSGECVVTAEGVVYHNMQYPNPPRTYDGGYVKFVAENDGDPVTINFSEFNCLRGENPVVFLYDGDALLVENFKSYSAAVPQGYMAALRPENANTDFVAESGVLCVLYAPASKSDFVTGYPSGSITGGYTATVTAGTPKDMEFREAVADNSTSRLYRGARNAVLGTVTVKMDGTLNPLTLRRLAIDLGLVAGSGKVENIRLYNGAAFTPENLAATLADGATELAVEGVTLKGKNVFTIVADVVADATGEIPAPHVTALTIGEVDRVADESTLGALAVANEIHMPDGDGHMTYVITEPAEFYDMGGPEGIIPVKAKGTVTFVPSREGDRIEVNVSSLALFNTSSTGMNDRFRFYNGREASEENLIAELLDQTRVMRSTAPDGSLTVTFEAVQGNVGKEGWEAVVSQFTPARMVLKGVEATAAETASPAAATSNVPLLLFDVIVEEQLNPLTVSAITLSSIEGADASALAAVKAYALGETATFSTKALYAEGTLGASCTLTGEYTLAEGHNWFAIAADIADTALTDAVAGIRLDGVTVGTATAVPTGETEVLVMVDNTCRITEGSHTHTMYGDWQFLSPAPTGYASNYPPSTADHVVTFVPTQPGATVQLEFSEFDVYYASSSYGSKSTFEVYSGRTADPSALLWKLADNASSKTGPGRKLRSTAADGALTVKFNPNASSSSYCGKGWKARAVQFVDHDAEITSVEVTQASTAILVPGSENAELLKTVIVTEGSLNPLTLSSVKIGVRGKEALESVNVLTSATGEFADATLWGIAAIPAEGNELTVTRAADVAATPLAEEANTLFITADILADVESEIEVDASLVSLGFEGGKTHAVADGNPEGVRVTKNVYILEEGTGHLVTVSRPIMFYDEGGPDGPITKGFKGTVTFVPANENEVLSVNAEEFSISSGKMYLYSGREIDPARILKNSGRSLDYYNTTTGPTDLISKADDGSITVDYAASTYIYGSIDGFAISVTPVKAEAMDVKGVTVTDGSEVPDVVRGSADVPVAHVAVESAGTTGKLTISAMEVDFNASTNVADILCAQVCYTGAAATFSPTTAIAAKVSPLESGKARFTFDTPVEIDEPGIWHFWLTADLSNSAVPGNTATATLTSLTANGAPAALPEACSGSRTMVTGMSGTYRVGPSDNARYHTLEAAVRALELGVEDAVLFLIEDGVYRENLVIANIAGTSAEHPVVFSSLSGNRDNVVIAGASSLDKQGMILVENSSFINFRNLTIAPNSTEYFAGIHFKDGSRHCGIENCVVKSDAVTGVSTGISLVRTEAVNEENRNCDYFSITDSYLEGGFIALYLGGTGYVALPKDMGLKVRNNTISGAYSKAIYVTDGEDFEISGNSITSGDEARKAFNAIDINRPHGAFRITANRIVATQTLDFTGIYTRSGGGAESAANPALIANNVIAVPNAASPYTYGVNLDASATNVVFAHNTVSINGSETLKSVYALAIRGNAPAEGAPAVVSNILQNTTAGAALSPWNASHYTNMTFASNVYYGPSDKVDGDGKTLAEYSEATGDLTSVMQQVSFFSNTDLHLREATDNMMFPLHALVGTDADGAVRPDPATAGAYEFAPVVVATPEIMEGYPAVASLSDVSATVKTRWSVGGSLYAMAVEEGGAAPDAEALKATRPVAVEADAENLYKFNFLSQLTSYRAYFLVVSALGEESAVVESPLFTTLETIAPLEVEIMWDEEPLAEGESILLQAGVTGGKEPYAYQWLDQMLEPVGSDETFITPATVNRTYRLRVTSADGQTVTSKAHVTVLSKNLVTATFDDLPLEAESNWKYDPEADENTFIDAFFSGSFQFGNFPSVQWQSWMGYGYANETATEFRSYDDQFRNAVGGGAARTAAYGVSYMYGADTSIRISHSGGAVTVPGVYVTNAAVTLNSVLNGDGFCRQFSADNSDYLDIIIIGLDASGAETGRVEVSLADYRDNVPSVLTEWKWIDLSPLGQVSALKLDFDSSQRSQVPAYVCFDELGAVNPSSGIGAADETGALRLAVPASDCLSVLGIEGSYTLGIYTADGVLRASHRLEGASTVSTAGLPAGACFAEIRQDGAGVSVLKFMKR